MAFGPSTEPGGPSRVPETWPLNAESRTVVYTSGMSVGRTRNMTDTRDKARSPALRAFQNQFAFHADVLFGLLASRVSQPGEAQRRGLPADGVSTFLARHSLLQQHFLDEISEAFERMVDPAKRARKKLKLGTLAKEDRESRINQLSLLNEYQLRQQLMLNRVSRRLRDQQSAAIAELDMRLEYLLCHRISWANNPLNPVVIIDAFERALQAGELNAVHIEGFVQWFVELLETRYGELLERCNQNLRDVGILPDIESDEAAFHSSELAESERAAERRESLMKSVAPDSQDGDHLPSSDAFYKGLLGLLQTAAETGKLDRHQLQHQAERASSEDALLAMLDQLDDTLIADDTEGYPELACPSGTLVEAVNTLCKVHEVSLSSREATSLSLVSLLFEDIRVNADLAPLMQALLLHLRRPFAKAAVLDTTFFSEPDNAAQDLLNLLAKAGTTWMPAGHRRRDALFNKIQMIVRELQVNFVNNYQLFDDHYEDFDLFLHAERRRAKLIEDRLIATEKARARTEQARLLAADHLQVRFPQRAHLPASLERFLDQDWRQVLFFIANKNSDPLCPEWKEACALEDRFVRLHLKGGDPEEGALRQRLRGLLGQVGFDDARASRVADEVLQSLKGTPPPPREAAAGSGVAGLAEPSLVANVPVAHESESIDPVGALEDSLSREQNEALDALLERLTMGTWLELKDGEQLSKVRVAAYIRPTRMFVLVNRNGTRTAQFNRAEMKRRIEVGSVRVLENTLFFERSLESVIQHLRQTDPTH